MAKLKTVKYSDLKSWNNKEPEESREDYLNQFKDKFKEPEELLDFILISCGGMEYYLKEGVSDLVAGPLDNTDNQLSIGGFDVQRIFYAIELLEDVFHISIDILRLYNIDRSDVIPKGYLDKTSIKELDLTVPIIIESLPDTIERISIDNPDYGIRISYDYSGGYSTNQNCKLEEFYFDKQEDWTDLVLDKPRKQLIQKMIDRVNEL